MFQGKKRAYLLYHRRAGKDIACWNYLIHQALHDKVGTYYYILPTYTQGKKVIWDGINESSKRFLDYIPANLIMGKPNSTEMKIKLVNGSVIQIIGSENYDSIRGTNPVGCVLSEYAMQDPRIWSEVLSPILLKNKGWAVFNTTPMGKNHAYDLWRVAEQSTDWYTQLLTIDDTKLITQEQIEQERREGKPEDVIQQEYFCSFERGIEGSYYSKLLNKARDEGRICRVPVDQYLPVICALDIGVNDSTAIWFVQVCGKEIRLVNYYENSGEGLAHYINVMEEWRIKNQCKISKFYAPHDIQVREFGTGMSRLDQARKLGVSMEVLPQMPLMDGIEAVRQMLAFCYFDAENCKHGIKCLESYRKHWNEKFNVYSDNPIHDFSSHGADAFRYLALALKRGEASGSGKSADEWKNIRRRNTI